MHSSLVSRLKKVNFLIVATFYIVSGIWEWLLIMEGDRLGGYFLVIMREHYLLFLGLLSITTGIGLFFRNNLFRVIALVLAYWNIVISPLIEIWWIHYNIHYTKKISLSALSLLTWLEIAVVITAMTLVRVYVIYVLKIDSSGGITEKDQG
jgi:hypothetical protein